MQMISPGLDLEKEQLQMNFWGDGLGKKTRKCRPHRETVEVLKAKGLHVNPRITYSVHKNGTVYIRSYAMRHHLIFMYIRTYLLLECQAQLFSYFIHSPFVHIQPLHRLRQYHSADCLTGSLNQ
jgi:hypothetical protein